MIWEEPPGRTIKSTLVKLTPSSKCLTNYQFTADKRSIIVWLMRWRCNEWYSPQNLHGLWVLVQKNDRSTYFCIEYKQLNKVTKDSFPLPRADDLLDFLTGAQWFSTLDLATRYWQIEVDPEHGEKQHSTLTRGYMNFVWCHSGFAMHQAPFSGWWSLCLQGQDGTSAWCTRMTLWCLDTHLRRTLTSYKLFWVDWEKPFWNSTSKSSRYFLQSVQFLVHVILCYETLPRPRNQEVASSSQCEGATKLPWLISYYHWFVKGFAKIAAPLHQLLQKDAYKWTEDYNQEFASLKWKLLSALILGYPRTNWTFYLNTGASYHSIGAALSEV